MTPLLPQVLLVLLSAATGPAVTEDKYLETIKVSDNIYVFKPKIDWSHGNGVAIIGPDGVFFIDTYIQFNYAEEAIRRLRAITKLPVRYVLNTHWHNDHVMGNGVFRHAFPAARFIAHDSTAAGMERTIRKAVEGEGEAITAVVAQLTQEIKDGKRTTGGLLTGGLKPFWEWQLRETLEYQKSFRPYPFVNADITFSDSLTMRWGDLTLKLIYMEQNGHSEGDVVVWIPEKRLVVAGDLVVGPTPYETNSNSPGLLKGLLALQKMDPAIIIPGHGAVEHDQAYLQLLIRAFGEYRRAAEIALAGNIPLKQSLDSIRFPDIDRQFTGGDDVKEWAFRSFFRNNIIYYTYKPPAPPKATPGGN